MFLVPVPLFFIFFDQLKNLNFIILERTHMLEDVINLSFLPLPVSSLIIPFLLLALLNNTKNISNTIYFVILSFFVALFSLSFSNRFYFSNFLNLSQFYLPFFALICGEIIGSKDKLTNNFFKYLSIVTFVIMSIQIISSIIKNSEGLNSDIFLFYIYQTEQYSSLILVLSSFICLIKFFDFKNSKIFNTKSTIYLLILLTYCFLSRNLLIFTYLTMYFILVISFMKKDKFINYLIISFIIIIIFYLNIDYYELSLNKEIIEKSQWYKIYLSEISSEPRKFLFGSNADNKLYANTKGIYNYYIDFIYNFGFISLLPLIFIIYLTFSKTIIHKKQIINNRQYLIIFFVLSIILVIECFIKVPLKQPYIGILSFFIWGIYYSKLISYNKKNEN